MSSTTTVSAESDIAGGVWWLSELTAVVQGKKRQAVTASHAENQQQQMGAAVHGEKAARPAGDGKRTEETVGGMSDAAVYLLLDRFAPS